MYPSFFSSIYLRDYIRYDNNSNGVSRIGFCGYEEWKNLENLGLQVSGREAVLTGGGGGHAPRPASTAEPPQASPSPGSPSGTQSTAPAGSAATAAVTLVREQITGPAGVAVAGQQPSGPGPGRTARVARGRVAAGTTLQANLPEIHRNQGHPTEETAESYHWIPHGHQRWPQRSSGPCHLGCLLHGPRRGEFFPFFFFLRILAHLS